MSNRVNGAVDSVFYYAGEANSAVKQGIFRLTHTLSCVRSAPYRSINNEPDENEGTELQRITWQNSSSPVSP